MFEKFGEFNSVQELNLAADGFKNEGDMESLKQLAEENGIDEMDLKDFIAGDINELASVMSAAFGRLHVEEHDVETTMKNSIEKTAVNVIFTMTKGLCTDEAIAIAVMQKGKRVKKIFDQMKKKAEKHKEGQMGICCGTDRELCELIKSYFFQSEKQFEQKTEELYR